MPIVTRRASACPAKPRRLSFCPAGTKAGGRVSGPGIPQAGDPGSKIAPRRVSLCGPCVVDNNGLCGQTEVFGSGIDIYNVGAPATASLSRTDALFFSAEITGPSASDISAGAPFGFLGGPEFYGFYLGVPTLSPHVSGMSSPYTPYSEFSKRSGAAGWNKPACSQSFTCRYNSFVLLNPSSTPYPPLAIRATFEAHTGSATLIVPGEQRACITDYYWDDQLDGFSPGLIGATYATDTFYPLGSQWDYYPPPSQDVQTFLVGRFRNKSGRTVRIVSHGQVPNGAANDLNGRNSIVMKASLGTINPTTTIAQGAIGTTAWAGGSHRIAINTATTFSNTRTILLSGNDVLVTLSFRRGNVSAYAPPDAALGSTPDGLWLVNCAPYSITIDSATLV